DGRQAGGRVGGQVQAVEPDDGHVARYRPARLRDARHEADGEVVRRGEHRRDLRVVPPQAQAEPAAVLERGEHLARLDVVGAQPRLEARGTEAGPAPPDHAHAPVRRAGEQDAAVPGRGQARAREAAALVVVAAYADDARVGRVAV